MRLEELLRHRRREPVAPPRRQRVEDHRRIEVALMVRGEDHRRRQVAQVLEPFDLRRARRRAPSGRIQVGRLARRSARAGAERFQDGKSIGSAARRRRRAPGPRRRAAGPAPRDRRPSVAAANLPSSTVTWSASSSAIISSTRSSELRPSSSIVVVAGDRSRPGAKRSTTARTLRSAPADGAGAASSAAPADRTASRAARGASASACPRCAAARRLATASPARIF